MTGIYKITCKPNNKIYVGQSIDINTRWVAHIRELNGNRHHNTKLQNAWNKYGSENFVFEIVEECSKEKLNDKEKYWIAFYDSFNNGYNLTIGGDGTQGKIYTEEQREKKRGVNNPFYGKHHKDGWNEYVEQFSMEKTCVSIVQVDKNTGKIVNEYKSISDAARTVDCSITAISLCLRGINNLAKDYCWFYKSSYKEGDRLPQNKKKRSIAQIDIGTNEIIDVYKSIADANFKFTKNKRNGKIIDCLSGKQKSAHGYKWIYV